MKKKFYWNELWKDVKSFFINIIQPIIEFVHDLYEYSIPATVIIVFSSNVLVVSIVCLIYLTINNRTEIYMSNFDKIFSLLPSILFSLFCIYKSLKRYYHE